MRDEFDSVSRRSVLRLGVMGLATGVGYSTSAAAAPLPNEIVISGRGLDGAATYEFSVSGEVAVADDPPGDTVSGQTASGRVSSWMDGYTFSGEITAFSYEGNIQVFLDGSEVDPDSLGDGSGALTNTLRITGVGERATYDFSVSGALEPGPDFDTDGTDSISGSSGAGTVAGTSGDDFSFSGEITDFAHDGPLELSVNGEQVDPDSFGTDSGDGGSDDGAGTRTLTFEGSPGGAYEFSVSGSLEKSTAMGASINSGDTISGSSADGGVGGGRDSYAFSGAITAFRIDDGVTVYLDEQQVDPDTLGGSETTHTIVIRGVDDEHVDYDLTVSGSLEKSTAMGASINAGDEISGSNATGFVFGGTDSYAFSGEITAFGYSGGEIEVFVDGSQVDPDSLGDGSAGGSSETTTITFEGTPGGSYDLTVSGSLEKSTAMGASINSGDTISGSSASGGIGGGRDSYVFTGTIERLRTDDGVTVYVDGERVDPGGTWSEKARLPREQTGAGGGVVDGKLYYFGGFDSGQGLDATARAFVYDPSASGAWDRIESMPRALWGPCGVSTGTGVFSFGGAPADSPYTTGDPPSDEIFVYTPGSGWTDLTTETGERCPYPNWAMNGVYNPTDGLIYCVGGATNVTDRESATDHGVTSDNPGKYDESRVWTFDPDSRRVVDADFARLPEAKRWPSVALVEVDGDDYIHALGGWRGTVGPTASNFRIDSSNGRVTRERSVPRAGSFATDTNPVVDNQVYLTHGRFSGGNTTVSYRYDPEADTFSTDVTRPEHVRGRAVDAVIDGTLYVVGGHVKLSSGYHQATTYNEAYTLPR